MLFKPVETISSALNNIQIKPGQTLYCTDTSESYLDTVDNLRVKITDIIYLETELARSGMMAPLTNKIYFVKETDLLYKYDGMSWVLVNNIVSKMYIETLKGQVTNTNNKTITINIAEYNPNIDLNLVVWKNAVRFFETTNYTLNKTNKTVTMVAAVAKSDIIRFEVNKVRISIA